MRKIVLTFVLTLAVISGLFANIVCYRNSGIGDVEYSIDVVEEKEYSSVRIWNITNRTVRVFSYATLTEAMTFYIRVCDDYWLLKANLLDPVKEEDIITVFPITFQDGTFVFLLLNDSNNINGRK